MKSSSLVPSLGFNLLRDFKDAYDMSLSPFVSRAVILVSPGKYLLLDTSQHTAFVRRFDEIIFERYKVLYKCRPDLTV